MLYKESQKMADLIADQPGVLLVMSRFGMPLGVGDQTVSEYCSTHSVDSTTFLAVANFARMPRDAAEYYVPRLKVESLIEYLKRAHEYFLDFQLPMIRRKLLEAVDCSRDNEVAYMILKFYDEYTGEVRRHMQHENRRIFTYVESLMQHRRPDASFEISQFARSHVGIDRKLQELKNIIIKYYTPRAGEGCDMLNNVLFDIYACEADLRSHCQVEDMLFVPAVRRLEENIMQEDGTPEATATAPTAALSDREKEVLACIVRGLSNKEISARLFISVNTVLTHRKNISRKLDIHSVSGLTIYAIVNHIVNLEDVR